MKRNFALVYFVKTPGLSPVKTRLAAAIGPELAEEFYRESIAICQELGQTFAKEKAPYKLTPYWAVAEQQGCKNELWSAFDTVFQGEGELGDRLAKIYSWALKEHTGAIFLGADAPQIPAERIKETIDKLQEGNNFVLGPASDGGYYLFAGKQPLEKTVWTSVPYSTKTTLAEFVKLLPKGKMSFLKPDFDVDDAATFSQLQAVLARTKNLSPSLVRLRTWFADASTRTKQ